jgi:hypothetical protein
VKSPVSEASESNSQGTKMKNVNKSAVNTVLKFMDRINQHDVDKLAEYMTEDHFDDRRHAFLHQVDVPQHLARSTKT